MTLATAVTASCFQLTPVDIDAPQFNSPVVLDTEYLEPRADVAFELDLDTTTNAVFKVNELFDANGFDEPRIYGRYWIDYQEGTLSSTNILIINRQDEDQHTTAEDREMCPTGGCWWTAQFTIPRSEWVRMGVGDCHQVTAVFSDSDWDDPCPGSQCTEQPTVLARVVWWVWVFDDATRDLEPGVTGCGEK